MQRIISSHSINSNLCTLILKLAHPLSLLYCLPQQGNHRLRILGSKRRTPGDNDIAPRIGSTLDCPRPYPAVYFNVEMGVAGAQVEDFGEARGDCFLAAKAGFHRLRRYKSSTEKGQWMWGKQPLQLRGRDV